MRIVTINYSGNLGKTIICAHLLSPLSRVPLW